jgi:hypothetical protein
MLWRGQNYGKHGVKDHKSSVVIERSIVVNVRIFHEQLVRLIQRYGAEAREQRQIYQRLSQLLPDRWRALVAAHRSRGLGPTDSARAAFASNDFINLVEEVVQFGASSLEARIQYETHMMLVDARRSLRAAGKR